MKESELVLICMFLHEAVYTSKSVLLFQFDILNTEKRDEIKKGRKEIGRKNDRERKIMRKRWRDN